MRLQSLLADRTAISLSVILYLCVLIATREAAGSVNSRPDEIDTVHHWLGIEEVLLDQVAVICKLVRSLVASDLAPK